MLEATRDFIQQKMKGFFGRGEASHPMVSGYGVNSLGVHRQQVGMAQNGDLSMNG